MHPAVNLVQCLTLLVLCSEYSTTKDTKITKEEKNILKPAAFLIPLSFLRVLRALLRKFGVGCGLCCISDR
jgi:hypothetical protein